MRPLLTYHRMIEAFNFAAAKVTFLTDPEFDSKINEVRNSNYSLTIHFKGEGNISSSNRWAKSHSNCGRNNPQDLENATNGSKMTGIGLTYRQ